ncbi:MULTISPECIES: nitroreductase/quinone reductase family protein [unclassified Streptomyces]|uniref:nitroreductase/quinone reductase family protein n=1 Tax=unclassified Streptomyces TaxID=2593676 RepID=UPI00081EF65D|nr:MULTISPECIES: nitroreductase/quinone reductase family protein [unclassified Streptomyces]MYZ39142.1 nitroreductase family deazaflavin-dependent oxidoreductase [Streptomyces sp. SID4917]SCG02354.1 deazaflavin-dependent oxidoreductase, nitroreductase family [Streptomyces sp. MnatMP-M17]
MPEPYYHRVGRFDGWLNSVIGRLARHGVSMLGTAEMSVRGRKSGQMQRIPVNPHTYGGNQYLISARGHSQWVRNMRVAGGGELRVGRRIRTFTATEIPDSEKLAVLRTYLERWGWEVNQFFQGVTAKSSDAEIIAAAPDHPVFLIRTDS